MEHIAIRARPTTVLDVARAAQVSKATAARALGGYGSVSPDVKARVLAVAQGLGYRPNELARTMVTGRSGTIGVVVGDIENPYFGLAVRGISDTAKAKGFGVILANSGERVEEERAAVDVLVAKQVDGLIVAATTMHDIGHLQEVVRAKRPLVLMDRSVPDVAADWVVLDDEAAATAATDLLIAAGHRRISYITATASPVTQFYNPSQIHLSTVLNRIAGVTAAATRAGIAEPSRYIRLGAANHVASQSIIKDLLILPDRPTAILASDDLVALEVFRTMKALGMSVPRDVSLITFHDAGWTSATTPAITVVAQPAYELGQAVAHMLIERIAGRPGPPRGQVLATTLIARDSVGPPSE